MSTERIDFQFLMLSAMYENGGNTTHRFLDGHPQLFVYPFESQLGTRLVTDHLSSTFPVKYRWPIFPIDAEPEQDYKLIIDEECKVRTRTPHVSKFRHTPFDLSDNERCEAYKKIIKKIGRSTASNVEAFYRSTFEVWKDFNKSGEESIYVGYSPVIIIDAEKILSDFQNAHILHVVRNPWSAYADTKKRPIPLPLHSYMLGWTLNQYYALLYKSKYPERIHIVRIEDVMSDSLKTLGEILEKLNIDSNAKSLTQTSFNGKELEQVYPWGTLRKVTPEVNYDTAMELTKREQDEIKEYTWQYLETFDYSKYI